MIKLTWPLSAARTPSFEVATGDSPPPCGSAVEGSYQYRLFCDTPSKMSKTERLAEIERRMREALAAALRDSAATDSAWQRFEASLKADTHLEEPAQNGMSSSDPAASGADAAGDEAAAGD